MSQGELVRTRRNPTDVASPSIRPLAEVRRLRATEKVAAICYRVKQGEIEFLLVETGGGRWTFPKGNIEAGLTHAQSAALEAFEEAGVHGRIEEVSFARYVTKKAKSGIVNTTSAYLCEVLWLDKPVEDDRNPTWFRVEKAKRRLRERRAPQDGAEHSRIVEVAVARLHHSAVMRTGTPRTLRLSVKK